MAKTSYAIGLGSNRRHARHGAPADTIRAAAAVLGEQGVNVVAMSSVRRTIALGPGGRSFANAAMIAQAGHGPLELLSVLKALERSFGRRRGQRWGARVLDLDILLWSEGAWDSGNLIIPHPAFRERGFVLDPLAEIAPHWRDPITGASVRQLRARLAAPRPLAPQRG